MSLFRFGFMWKSLDTVTESENIQATQQLNSTNQPGDERKAESEPEKSLLGKANEFKIPNVMGVQLSLASTGRRKEHHEVHNLLGFFSEIDKKKN